MRSSQGHKAATHGLSSDFQYGQRIKSLTQHGTEVIPAKIEVYGLWPTGAIAQSVINIGGADLPANYTVTGAPYETAEQVAAGLEAVIEALADVNASVVHEVISVVKATAGSVRVVSVSIG